MIKVETRGKYAGVKIHLDAEECQKLMEASDQLGTMSEQAAIHGLSVISVPLSLAKKMGQKIKELNEENPDLLKERTPEQIQAILIKEQEKAAMQLNAIKSGKKWSSDHINKEELKKQLLKYVEG